MRKFSIAAVLVTALAAGFLLSPRTHPEGTPSGTGSKGSKLGTGPTTPAVSKYSPIAWTPSELVVTLSPGETKIVEATATIRRPIPTTVAELVSVRVQSGPLLPTFESYVTVRPRSAPASPADTQRAYTLSFLVASSTALQTIHGMLRLRSGIETIAQPLPIKLNVWPHVESSGGISFHYPPQIAANGGSLGNPEVTSVGFGTAFDVPVLPPAGQPPENGFRIVLEENTSHSSLESWFVANIDPSRILLTAGTFTLEHLPDGRELLLSNDTLPDDYDGLVSVSAFVMSPAREYVASITLSQDHRLDLVGYTSSDEVDELLRSIIIDLTFPLE